MKGVLGKVSGFYAVLGVLNLRVEDYNAICGLRTIMQVQRQSGFNELLEKSSIKRKEKM